MSETINLNTELLSKLSAPSIKGKDQDAQDPFVNAAIMAAYTAIINAFCKTQAEAAKEDAQQTEKQITEGQATAEVDAAYAQASSSKGPSTQGSSAQSTGNGALEGGAAAISTGA